MLMHLRGLKLDITRAGLTAGTWIDHPDFV